MAERDGLQYLHRREDGRHVYRVRPYVGTPRRRVSDTFDMPTDSIKAARKRAIEVVRALDHDANLADKDRPTVKKLFDDWMERGTETKSPRTLSGYRPRVSKIVAKFGTLPATDLTPEMVDAWYHELRKAGVSEAEILEIHRKFSAALQWARKLRRITEAVTEFVETPDHRAPKVSPPPVPLMLTLMKNLPTAEWARFVALLALTGARRGEIAGLRWADLDGFTLWIRNSVIEVAGEPQQVQPYPKSREHRMIELHPAAVAVLEQQRAYVEAATSADVEWVFPDWNSWRYRLPRRPSTINRAWSRYRIKHGARNVRPHDLRHFFATQALAGGALPHDVAKQLGHRDVATTMMIYGHATEAGQRVVVNAVAGSLGYSTD